ncbi:unnamed protein product [Thlaspi arvense]|uniref:Uncharacterized protein n=1 Tax=Thlaspi arvense TaxID=13288 RepID=A0AAU9SWA4_THLAR|nr:unnamed protein product [Thlaspi arvense]
MNVSAIKGDLELKDSDADIRKSSSMISRIYVEGYDTKLPGHALARGLTKHFASCGRLIHIYIPGFLSMETRILNSFALIYLRGEGVEEKALKLNGTRLRGRKLVVKAYPFHSKHLRPVLARTRAVDGVRGRSMTVTGYDASLTSKHVKRTLTEHFSKCGYVLSAFVSEDRSEGVLESRAFITLMGQSAINKALQLGGCDVEGFQNIQVTRVDLPDPSPAVKNKVGYFARLNRRNKATDQKALS